ncbi:variable large family protein [Borrelia puertoricensis]|uniref:variable large family protein n=1 Tax=Borrelia puertoricensis TaxID=2756107 RepID=UPI001FF218A1|nr:variable large family protein [Borrelia puertoricensis]UPA19297.1 variable large family protein [Borrelia puertoricensis]
MTLFLLLSCGSGQQSLDSANGGGAATGGSSLSSVLMDIGRSAENAFYSFLDLLSGTLGLRVTKDTKKSDVAGYFSSLGAKLGVASKELEEVVVKATSGVDTSDASKNPIKVAIDTAKATLSTLKTHLDSLKDIGDDNKVVDVTVSQSGVAANQAKLESIYDALKGIVTAATTEGIAEPKKSTVKVINTSLGGTNPENGAKVLTSGAVAGGDAGLEAATIVSTVSGEEILAAIVGSSKSDAAGTISSNVNQDTSALKFAKGGATASHLAQTSALAGAVSGGIALRSLVKDGKLASHSGNDNKAVQSAGITAVNKLLVAVEDVIKKTVKNVLKTAKDKIDEARAPKEAGQQ